MKRRESSGNTERSTLSSQQRSFRAELSRLTEEGVIQWHRVGGDMRATLSLELSEDELDLANLVVVGEDANSDNCEVYSPLPQEALMEPRVELEIAAEAVEEQRLNRRSFQRARKLSQQPPSIKGQPA